MERSTVDLGEDIESGRLTVFYFNRYNATLAGTVSNLRVIAASIARDVQVSGMVLYCLDIGEPHRPNGWKKLESWNYSRIKAFRA